MPRPSSRFLLLISLGMLAACSAFASAVLFSVTWREARSLDVIFPFYDWRTRPFTPEAFSLLRQGLGLNAVILAVAATALGFTANARREMLALGKDINHAWQSLKRTFAELTGAQRHIAGGLFGVLTLVRIYFSLSNPEYDDAVSYEIFVSKGLLATSAYYPIPNNHVFSNTIACLFYQISPAFWWSMRFPVLLISTAATILLFALLKNRVAFRAAAIAILLFSSLQLSLYHAGVGRGYWLVIAMAGAVFFSTLVLVEKEGNNRGAWLALLVCGILGCYTVPTFAYVLTSAFTWLSLQLGSQRKWRVLGQVVGIGMITVIGTTLLYAPLLLVSGFDRFTGNGFVAPLTASAFWSGLPAYVWHTEGFLAGQRTLGTLITLPILGLVGWLFMRARRGLLERSITESLQRLGWPALWFMFFPYVLILVQRVFPPERVMLYKAFFFFLLLGLVVDWYLNNRPAPTHRWTRPALVALGLAFVLYQAATVVRVNPSARRTNAAYRQGLLWLAQHRSGPLLIPEPTHNIFFRFYAHTEARNRPWRIDETQQPNTTYAYVVAFPNKRGFFQPQFNFAPAYQNSEVEIYAVPANYPLATAAWRH